MIIQCRQCRTKFRFDDSLMQGNGVWLRCSRCGHVYFQENPQAQKPSPDVQSEPAVGGGGTVSPVDPSTGISDEIPSVFYRDEKGGLSSEKIMEARKRIKEEIIVEEKNAGEKFSEENLESHSEETLGENVVTGLEQEEKPSRKKRPARKKSDGVWKIALWSVVVILIIPGFIYFLIFPEYGEQLIGSGRYFIDKINEYRGISPPVTSGAHINQMIKLQDVRYRRINNYILGQIAIVEGMAVNAADYPVARIKIKGELLDAYSVVVGEQTSYAGNILTDEELTNLSEEEILTRLMQPQGMNNVNDRIMPNGQIPFMIVFPNEPAGVIKTTVVTVGAEKLLE